MPFMALAAAALPTVLQMLQPRQADYGGGAAPMGGVPAGVSGAGGGAPSISGTGFSLGIQETLRGGGTGPYADFYPGGSFAPPTLRALAGAFQGSNSFATFASAVAPGLGQQLGSLIGGGVGAGQRRRSAAKTAAQGNTDLQRFRMYAAKGSGSQADAEWLTRTIASADPAAARALLAIVNEAARYGGYGSAQGERANYLGDQIKWLYTGETAAPKRFFPNFQTIVGWLQSPVSYSEATRFAS